MTPDQRGEFRSAYGELRGLDSFLENEEFWSISTLVNTARIHARFQHPIESFLEQLDGIVQGRDAALWPDHSK